MPRKTFSGVTMAEAIAVLSEDHRRLLGLFDEFERIRCDTTPDFKEILVEIACTELVIHAQVEEEFLYPALRLQQVDPLLPDEARVEHLVARQVIGDLEMMEPDDELYDARVMVLGKYLRHHIAEEESRMFPLLREAPAGTEGVADALLTRRETLRSEFGLPDDQYEDLIAPDGNVAPPSRSEQQRPRHP